MQKRAIILDTVMAMLMVTIQCVNLMPVSQRETGIMKTMREAIVMDKLMVLLMV